MSRTLGRRDIDGAGLSVEDVSMLRYAVKLTRAPHSVTEADVAELRNHGFDDGAIHDICHVASYYNYVNRIADGLGVELEEWWEEDEMTITRGEFDAARQ